MERLKNLSVINLIRKMITTPIERKKLIKIFSFFLLLIHFSNVIQILKLKYESRHNENLKLEEKKREIGIESNYFSVAWIRLGFICNKNSIKSKNGV